MTISGALNLTATSALERAVVNSRSGSGSSAADIRETSSADEAPVTTVAPGEIENREESGQSPAPLAPRPLVDPANLSQAQEAAEETDTETEDDGTLTISARLVPVGDEDSTESVALDGRPEGVKAGELVSESQRLTGEPLEVPNYSIDPAEQDIQVFNERISRSTQVLEFLNSRPAPRSGGGLSIIA
ncbi:hypothetical protein [Nisaea sp.]|uniref:hypothetical protein n=1 Tax=Nisaea sp. TaxID=2024842 RepID=UPI002B2775A2|nr:hypothetical protein [Nisaea sp.]